KVDIEQPVEALDQKAGANHQHHGQSNLEDHQQTPQARLSETTRPSARAAGAQAPLDIECRYLERRPESTDQADDDGHHQAEDQNGTVDANSGQPWHVVGAECDDQANETIRQSQSENPAKSGQK